jgi:hypothetical protein
MPTKRIPERSTPEQVLHAAEQQIAK